MEYWFQVTYLSNDGKEVQMVHRWVTKEEALAVGYELTRDFVARFFRVDRRTG